MPFLVERSRSGNGELLGPNGVALDVVDERVVGVPLAVRFQGSLTAVQQTAAATLLAHGTRVFVAPPGVGKTVGEARLPAVVIPG